MVERTPLSASQRGNWAAQRLFPGAATFRVSPLIWLAGPVDTSAFAEAVGDAFAETEALRVRFDDEDGVPFQTVDPESILSTLIDDVPQDDERIRALARADVTSSPTSEPATTSRLLRRRDGGWAWSLLSNNLLLDGYSLSLFTRRVAEFYSAAVAGTPAPASRVGGLDEAVAAAATEDSDDHTLAYWRDVLGIDSDDFARTQPDLAELFSFSYRPITVPVRAAIDDRLRSFARRAKVSWSDLIVALWGLYTSAVEGRDHLTVRIPMMLRDSRELLRTPLAISRALPVVVPTRPHDTLSAVLHAVGDQIANARKHSAIEDHQIARLWERGASSYFRFPSVNIRVFRQAPRFSGLTVTTEIVNPGPIGELDLAVHVDDGIRMEISGHESVISPHDAEQHATRFADFLDAVLDAPHNATLYDVSLLVASPGTEQLGPAVSTAAAEFPVPDQTVDALVRAQSDLTPAAVAVVDDADGVELTYRAFDARVNALAALLVEGGVGVGDRVAVALPRSADLVVVLAAVLRAGGAYVPVDPGYPGERVVAILEDSGARAVVTDVVTAASRAGVFAGAGVVPVVVDDPGVRSVLDAGVVVPPVLSRPLTSQDVAYVIFTSGTTGRPKGVEVSHGAVTNRLTWGLRELGFSSSDRVLLKTPFTFDVSVPEFFLPLVVGATVVVAQDGAHGDPDYIARVVRERRVTSVHFVPSMLQAFLDSGVGAGRFPEVRLVSFTGEALPVAAAVTAREVFNRARLFNLYGPTEAAVEITSYDVAGLDAAATSTPIGRPITNSFVRLLDGWLRPVPVGVAGELYLGGVQIAQGYAGQFGLTAERFVADPFGERGERLYRTGDVVRWNDRGELEYLGRSDDQVKVRGFRIELDEIQAIVERHPAVSGAVVVALDHPAGGKYLAAYVTTAGDALVEHVVLSGMLREYVAGALPEYMVPASFMALDRFPVSGSGKLSRGALPAPDLGGSVGGRLPETTTEVVLAGVFREILALDDDAVLSVGDDFFRLGGHSLLATRVVARVNAQWGSRLTLRDVFDHPTIEGLARVVVDFTREAAPALRVGEAPRPDIVPASFGQQALWVIDRLGGPGGRYVVPVVLRLTGELDEGALGQAIRDVVARHEVLRTLIVEDDAQLRQVVVPIEKAAARLPVAVEDVTAASEHALRARVAELVRSPFDLAADIPIRARLLRVAGGGRVLVLAVHHHAVDEWSLPVLLGDLSTAYRARVAGTEPGWAPLAVQYADYAVWQREILGDPAAPGSEMSRHLSYWREALDEAPEECTIASDRSRPAVPTHRGGEIEFVVDPGTVAGLRRVAEAQGVSIFMIAQAATALTVSALGGHDDVVIGSPTGGRMEDGLEDLVGYFVNTLPVRHRFRPDDTLADVLWRTRDTVLNGFAHQAAPFEQIAAASGVERSANRNPVFQVMLTHQHLASAADDASLFPGAESTQETASLGAVKTDLDLYLTDTPDTLIGRLAYATDLYDHRTAVSFVERLLHTFDQIAANPGGAVAELELLRADDVRDVSAWTTGAQTEATSDTVDSFVRKQSALTPAAVAVIDDADGVELTFARFDARVNALARILVEQGVTVGERVAVALPRSADLVVALAAVLRAGGAYVPVDPTYPGERARAILEDAGVRIVMTDTVTSGVHESAFAAADVSVVSLDEPGLDTGVVGPPVLSRPLVPGDVAYVLFTSGTTGRPKGVEVSHGAVVNRLVWMRDDYRIGVADRVLLKTPFTFDVSVWEFFLPLITGAALVVARDGGHKDPEYLAEAIQRRGVTVAHFVPSMLHAFLDSRPDPQRLSSVRRVFFSGEALPAMAAVEADQLFAGAGLHNLYGPTEATVDVTAHPVDPTGLTEATAVPIGGPVSNAFVRVLDGWLRPVPAGTAGELYLGGVQLAQGYVGQPGLSASRFIADPLGESGARVYRTGDVVRWTQHGVLEYLGRSDDQVKIRGFRIEPDEIRAVLERHPVVSGAAVVVLDHPAGGKFLAAYVTSPDGVPKDDAEFALLLREHAAGVLPEHMIPTTITRLDAFPVTANGKLDRRALPTPAFGERGSGGPAAESETELVLAEVFRDVLRLDDAVPLSVDDDFFRLGGDSILSIQVVSRARRAGVAVTAAEVFTARTISALTRLADKRSADSAVPAAAVVEVPGAGLWPIAAQFASQPGFGSFAQSCTFATPPGLGHRELLRVLARVAGHHAALWGKLVADVKGSWRFETGVEDVRGSASRVSSEHLPVGWSSPEWAGRVRSVTAELAQALDPESGVLWRGAWFTSDAEASGRLLLVIHHLVVDGVSWRVIGDDLAHAWELEAGQTTAPLMPVGTSMPAWSHALTSRAASGDIVKETVYWSQVAAEPEPLLGSRALDPQQDIEATAGRVAVSMPADVTRAVLTRVPHVLSAEVNDVLLGALTVAVGAWRARRGLDHRGVLVGLEGHGREEGMVPGTDLSRTVGWFTSWYPVFLSAGDTDSTAAASDPRAAADAVLRVKEQLRGVPGRGIGYGLLRHLNSETGSTLAAGTVPQVGFNYLGQFASADRSDAGGGVGSMWWGTAPEEPGIRGYAPDELPLRAVVDINIAAIEDASGERVLRGGLSYASGILDEADARELVDLFEGALTAVAGYAKAAEVVRKSPSDLTVLGAVQTDIDGWEEKYGELEDVFPLSPLQEGIAFESLMATDRGAEDDYVVQSILHLDGDVDPGRLKAALDRLLIRFPNLKTAITPTADGEYVAIIPARAGVPFRVVETDTGAEFDATVQRVIDAERAARFDLASPPMIRTVLIQELGGSCTLVLTLHHVLADGWSTSRIIRELLYIYNHPYDAIEPDETYRKFLSWLADRNTHDSAAQWRSVLGMITQPTLVSVSKSDTPQSPRSCEISIDDDVVSALTEIAREQGATLSTVLQAAWSIFLRLVTQSDAVVFGTTVSGRPAEVDGMEDAVGLFINTIPIPVNLSDSPTLREIIDQIQATNAALIDHHHTPLSELHRISGHTALFDVLFVYENYPVDERGFKNAQDPDSLSLRKVTARDSTHYPLVLVVRPRTSLQIVLAYRPDMLDDSVVERCQSTFERILALMPRHLSLPLPHLLHLIDAAREPAMIERPVDGVTQSYRLPLDSFDVRDAPLWHSAIEQVSLAVPEVMSLRLAILEDGNGELRAEAENPESLDVVQGILTGLVASYGTDIALDIDRKPATKAVRITRELSELLDDPFWDEWIDAYIDVPETSLPRRSGDEADRGSAVVLAPAEQTAGEGTHRAAVLRAVASALGQSVAEELVVEFCEPDDVFTVRRFPVLINPEILERISSPADGDTAEATIGLAPERVAQYIALVEHPQFANIFDDVPSPLVRVSVFRSDAQTAAPVIWGSGRDDVELEIRVLIAAGRLAGTCSVRVEVETAPGIDLDVVVLAGTIAQEIARTGIVFTRAAEPALRLHRADRLTLSREDEEDVRARYGRDAEILPLSPLQRGLFYHLVRARESDDHNAYVSQITREFSGDVDPDRMEQAAIAALGRHPNLRAAFIPSGEAQVIPAGADVPFRVIRSAEWARLGVEVSDFVADERRQPFDFETPPLIRFTLIEHAPAAWALVLSFEHILLDGWSLDRFLEELLDLYADPGYADRVPPVLFRSYLDWLDAQDPDAVSRVWEEYLAGLSGPTLLWPEGGDLGGGQVDTGELHHDLDPATASAVFATARDAGATIGTLLQTAWGLTLGRITGSDDVVFGNTVSGRPAELHGSDRIIGLLFNTVPMRVGLTPIETVGQLLARVQGEQLTVIDYPHASLTKIQAGLGMPSLFDTLFVVQNIPLDATEERDWAGVKVVGTMVNDATHYPVTFAVNPWVDEGAANVHVRLSYRRDALDTAAAERLLQRYLLVLSELAGRAYAPVGEVTALLADEARPYTGVVADLRRSVEDITVAGLMERQVLRSPGDVALVAGSRRFTFADFSAEVNRYARLLLERGVRSEHRVALLLPRDERMVIAMFAVFVVGAAYVPVDAELPDERIAYMLSVARPTVTLVTDRDAARLGTSAGQPVNLDDAAVRARISELDAGPITTAERGSEISLDHLAYIIFTSGSTGRPKGVAVGYRGLTNMYANHVEKIFDRVVAQQDGRRLRIAHTTSFSFDASWEQLFWLLNGSSVYVIDEEMRRDPQRLLAYYDHERIDGFDVTPSYGQVLVDEGLLERDRTAGRSVAADAPGVVFVSLGGEAVPERLWQQLRDAPGVASYNLYGPTEYTINALGADLADSATPSVGTPIFNTRAYILDENLQPTLPGVAGELYLAGAGNARGYWEQPALTGERFVACPWGLGERMYRTGDLARWNSEGHIDYLGRADEQVKIRGYRIEPDEIRTVLEKHPLVAGAAVIAVDHPSSGKFLAAYVVSADAEMEDAALRDAVRAHAEQQLPDYMVPVSYMRVDEFPLTPNGKLDRRALPEPDLGQSAVVGRGPETETEHVLMEAVRAVLRLSDDAVCSVDDDFFRLGGDSILSIQLVSRVRRAGLTIAASEVFSARTVAALALIVDQGALEESAPSVVRADVRSSRLWPIAHGAAGSPGFASFVQAALYTVPAGTPDELVTRVLARVIEHHHVLNARLGRADDGDYRFELLKTRPEMLRESVAIQQVESDWSDPEWADSIHARVTTLAHTMDPERGVLWRAILFRSGTEATSRLLLVVHHLVVDGVSWRILEDDLQHSWEIETGHLTDRLLPVGTSMTAWAEALATRAVATDIVAQTAYWADIVTAVDPLLGTRGIEQALDKRETAGRAQIRVPSSVAGPLLSSVPSALAAEVNDVLLGSLAIAVGAWRARRGMNHRRILIGLEGHGREEPFVPRSDLSRTVGWFTTWYPVGLDTAGADPVAALGDAGIALEAVMHVRDQLRQVPDKGIGYGILRSLNPEAAAAFTGGHPPQIGFNYLGQFGGGEHAEETAWAFAPEAPGLSGASDESAPLSSVLDINISAVPDPEDGGWALRVSIAYASGILSEAEVQELSDLWVTAMTQLSTASEARLAVSSSMATSAQGSGSAASDLLARAIQVPLLPTANGSHLFAVHPLEGFAFVYGALGQYLPPGVGLVGLQDPAHAGVDADLNSRAHVAAVYADVIQRIQPSGPYHLLGWSLGAYIAYTVGQELERRGERVASLTIVDAPVKGWENKPQLGQSWKGYAPVYEENEEQTAIIARSRGKWLSMLGLHADDDGAEDVLKAMAVSTLRGSRMMSTETFGEIDAPAMLVVTAELSESVSRDGRGLGLSWDSYVRTCTTVLVADEDHYSILNDGSGLPKWGPELTRFLEESIRSENEPKWA